mgnify:CR=1 FL=1
MNLRDRYPDLVSFIGAYFADLDDREAVKDFLSEESSSQQARAIDQLKSLLQEKELPYEELEHWSLRNLPNTEEARQWLAEILAMLETKKGS